MAEEGFLLVEIVEYTQYSLESVIFKCFWKKFHAD